MSKRQRRAAKIAATVEKKVIPKKSSVDKKKSLKKTDSSK
tara:strand:+ start:631 stop:750 length:120 start_codon:yes stop_codon:yes gene_type:complete